MEGRSGSPASGPWAPAPSIPLPTGSAATLGNPQGHGTGAQRLVVGDRAYTSLAIKEEEGSFLPAG